MYARGIMDGEYRSAGNGGAVHIDDRTGDGSRVALRQAARDQETEYGEAQFLRFPHPVSEAYTSHSLRFTYI
jgi:hypothetical protein